jgi:hypothetical protein
MVVNAYGKQQHLLKIHNVIRSTFPSIASKNTGFEDGKWRRLVFDMEHWDDYCLGVAHQNMGWDKSMVRKEIRKL